MGKLADDLRSAFGKNAREIFWVPMGIAVALVVTIATVTAGLMRLLLT